MSPIYNLESVFTGVEHVSTPQSTSHISKGIASSRMITMGRGFSEPIASNDTDAGRAQNRRVEFAITANEKMINDAKSGN